MNKFLNLFKIDLNLQERIFGLDLMRSAAIILVVFIHADIIVRDAFPHFPEFWVIDGVDIFFVLSGFLIGKIIINNFNNTNPNFSKVKQFWKRRWFRTLPNYFLVLFLFVIYMILIKSKYELFSIKYLLFLQNFNWPHPNFFDIAWSLSIEEWFYVFFPISILGTLKLFPKQSLKSILWKLILAFILFSTIYRVYLTIFVEDISYNQEFWELHIRKIVLTRFDTIMYGVFGAFLFFYFPQLWNKYKIHSFFFGIFLILVSHFYFKSGFLKYTFYLNVEGIGIFLLLPLLSNIKKAKSWIQVPITYISLISYSIYLVHFSLILMPLLHFFPARNPILSLIMYGFYYVSTVLVSIILYKYFERPIMNLREKHF